MPASLRAGAVAGRGRLLCGKGSGNEKDDVVRYRACTHQHLKWPKWLTWGVAALAALVLVGWLLVGNTVGTEFSPDLFCHRSFDQLDFMGWKLTPRRTEKWRTPLDEYLHTHGFVPPSSVEQPRWHVIRSVRPGIPRLTATTYSGGEAYWKCVALGCRTEGNELWIRWSEERPDCAKRFWPHVVALARQGRYTDIYDLGGVLGVESVSELEEILGEKTSESKESTR